MDAAPPRQHMPRSAACILNTAEACDSSAGMTDDGSLEGRRCSCSVRLPKVRLMGEEGAIAALVSASLPSQGGGVSTFGGLGVGTHAHTRSISRIATKKISSSAPTAMAATASWSASTPSRLTHIPSDSMYQPSAQRAQSGHSGSCPSMHSLVAPPRQRSSVGPLGKLSSRHDQVIVAFAFRTVRSRSDQETHRAVENRAGAVDAVWCVEGARIRRVECVGTALRLAERGAAGQALGRPDR